jgi:hypothetical protein
MRQPAIAWFLRIDDLVLAKLAAGRPKDMTFARDAIRSGLVDVEHLERSVELLPESHREITRERLVTAVAGAIA